MGRYLVATQCEGGFRVANTTEPISALHLRCQLQYHLPYTTYLHAAITGIIPQQWHLHSQQCPAALSPTTPNNSNTSAGTPQAAPPSHPACSKHRYSPPYPPTNQAPSSEPTNPQNFPGLHNQTLESHNRRPRMANLHLPLQPPNPENPPRRLPHHRQAPPRLRHDGEIL